MTETFGYFRALPFGWTDCSDTDAGAVALYTFEQIVEFVRTAMLAESAEWTGDYRGPVFRAFEDAALRMGIKLTRHECEARAKKTRSAK